MLKRKQSGFTLVEIAIVVMVMGLILGGVLTAVSVQRQQLKRDETRQQLSLIKNALIGYALSNRRLPCPDTDGDGLENRSGAPLACDDDEAFLPFVDIGVGVSDTWGNAFRYRVTLLFADDPVPSFVLTDTGDITINNTAGLVATQIPAIVLSYGENGTNTISNIACPAGAPSAVEDENCNDDSVFYDDVYSNLAGSEFDDLVTWIPLPLLMSRMVEAGQLP